MFLPIPTHTSSPQRLSNPARAVVRCVSIHGSSIHFRRSGQETSDDADQSKTNGTHQGTRLTDTVLDIFPKCQIGREILSKIAAF